MLISKSYVYSHILIGYHLFYVIIRNWHVFKCIHFYLEIMNISNLPNMLSPWHLVTLKKIPTQSFKLFIFIFYQLYSLLELETTQITECPRASNALSRRDDFTTYHCCSKGSHNNWYISKEMLRSENMVSSDMMLFSSLYISLASQLF